ncbi:MAG: DUF2341 domain-containing protein [Candidatus Stahlbacteria bacterium]|nr:MAG: DUF2341 domain-containing protein [Candidatus Stahlbacteria bacterium]
MTCRSCIADLAKKLVSNYPKLDWLRALVFAEKAVERYEKRVYGANLEKKYPESEGWKDTIIDGKSYKIRTNPKSNPYDYELNCTEQGNCTCIDAGELCIVQNNNCDCDCPTPKANSYQSKNNCGDSSASCGAHPRCLCLCNNPACSGSCEYRCGINYVWNAEAGECEPIVDWCRRKSHVINQQAGAGTNYQTCIKVYKGAGIDGTEVLGTCQTVGKVYCGGNCRDDFGDIRFTEDDGETELDYWIEEYTAGVSALIWVEVSGDLTTGNVTIYIYYDNAVATYPHGADQTEMDATFMFADHFYGDTLDLAKWTVESGVPVVVGSVVTISGQPCLISGNVTWTGENSRCRAKVKTGAAYYEGFFEWIDADNNVGFNREGGGPLHSAWTEEASVRTRSNYGWTDNVWWILQYLWKVNNVKFCEDNVLKQTHVTNVPSGNVFALIKTSGQATAKIECDWLFAAKYVDPEPVHGAWGAEDIIFCACYDNEIDCEANGCCWFEGTCYSCDEVPCGYWDNQVDCEAADCCWCCVEGVWLCQECPCVGCTANTTQENCEACGCNWCCVGGVWFCQEAACPTCADYDNQADCEACGCNWCLIDGVWQCVAEECPEPECSDYDNQISCEAAGCCWCDGVCQDCPCPTPPPPPPPSLCSEYDNQIDCEVNGCCWCLIDEVWQCVDCPCPEPPCVQWSHRVCESRIRRRRPYRRGNHPSMHRH